MSAINCLLRGIIIAGMLCIGISSMAMANEQVIEAEGSYIMGDSESAASAKNKARLDAMRMVTEKAGVYVKSYTEVKNMEMTTDELTTMAGKLLKILSQDCVAQPIGDTVKYVVHIKAVVDTSSIDEQEKLRKEQDDKEKEVKENSRYQELQKLYNELSKELERLKKQPVILGKTTNKQESQQYKDLEERYNQLNRELENLKRHPQTASKTDSFPNYMGRESGQKGNADFQQAMQAANIMLAGNDYEGIIGKLLPVKNAGNQDAELNRLLGLAYYRSEKYFEAMLCYRDALQIVTDNGQWYKEYGDVLYTKGRYKDALKAYDKALSLDDSLYAAHANRGATMWVMGQIEIAIDEYKKAVSLNRKDDKLFNAKNIMESSYFFIAGSYKLRNAVTVLPLV